MWTTTPAHGRRARGPAAVTLIALAVAAAAAGCSGGSPHAAGGSPSTDSPSAPTSSPSHSSGSGGSVPTLQPPSGGRVPAGFEPGSVTFVSATTGFVLGTTAHCASAPCTSLLRTWNAGRTWVGIPAPRVAYVTEGHLFSARVGVRSVRFADPLDGWAFGPSLYATHDGGATWQPVAMPGAVLSLATAAGHVFAVVSRCHIVATCSAGARLMQAADNRGGFTTVAAPSGPAPYTNQAFALHPPAGFALVAGGGPQGTGGTALLATAALSASGSWHRFPNPCPNFAQLDGLAAPDAVHLFTLCAGAAAAGSQGKMVEETANGRSHLAGRLPFGGDAEAIAAATPTTLVVAANSGAGFLYRSTDGGRVWTATSFNNGGVGFVDLGFTTATFGEVVEGGPGAPVDHLLVTRDAGVTWSVVRF